MAPFSPKKFHWLEWFYQLRLFPTNSVATNAVAPNAVATYAVATNAVATKVVTSDFHNWNQNVGASRCFSKLWIILWSLHKCTILPFCQSCEKISESERQHSKLQWSCKQFEKRLWDSDLIPKFEDLKKSIKSSERKENCQLKFP